MVDMTNFQNWTIETKVLSEDIEALIIKHLQANPGTKAESVVPALLLAAWRLHLRVCDRLEIPADKALANFLQQAKLAPMVHAENQAKASDDHCIVCGCTHTQPCITKDGGTCYWVEPGLCSVCEAAP